MTRPPFDAPARRWALVAALLAVGAVASCPGAVKHETPAAAPPTVRVWKAMPGGWCKQFACPILVPVSVPVREVSR